MRLYSISEDSEEQICQWNEFWIIWAMSVFYVFSFETSIPYLPSILQ